jgi:hypothetical protein
VQTGPVRLLITLRNFISNCARAKRFYQDGFGATIRVPHRFGQARTRQSPDFRLCPRLHPVASTFSVPCPPQRPAIDDDRYRLHSTLGDPIIDLTDLQ